MELPGSHKTKPAKAPLVTSREVLFNPIKTKRAFEKISTEIKQIIFKGTLQPGDKLPSEAELANQFGVGRQTIREALRLLELSGFISMQKGGAGGALVVDTILNTISNSFLDLFQMKRMTMNEVTVARIEIEKMVLSNVILHAETSDIELLHANVQRAREKIAHGVQAFDDNIQFHKLLAKASGNQVYVIVMESIIAVVAHFRSLLGMDLELSSQVVEDHEKIVEAIIRRDHDTALKLLESHLLDVDRRFKGFISRQKKRGRTEDYF